MSVKKAFFDKIHPNKQFYICKNGAKVRYRIDKNLMNHDQIIITRQKPNEVYGDVEIPPIISGLWVHMIEEEAFKGCRKLSSITVSPDFIGDEAFANCVNLSRVNISFNCNSYLSSRCFKNCTSLMSVSISDATYIGNECFSNCVSLESIRIPDTAECFGNKCFAGCINLKKVQMPKYLHSCPPDVFPNPESIHFICSKDSPAISWCRNRDFSFEITNNAPPSKMTMSKMEGFLNQNLSSSIPLTTQEEIER